MTVIDKHMSSMQTSMQILHAEALRITAERGLHQGILSQTHLKCHIQFLIFICKQLKMCVAFGAGHAWSVFPSLMCSQLHIKNKLNSMEEVIVALFVLQILVSGCTKHAFAILSSNDCL